MTSNRGVDKPNNNFPNYVLNVSFDEVFNTNEAFTLDVDDTEWHDVSYWAVLAVVVYHDVSIYRDTVVVAVLICRTYISHYHHATAPSSNSRS